MANMLNNDNFEHWVDSPNTPAFKVMAIILALLVCCLLSAVVIVKTTNLLVVEPTKQAYSDMTEKIDKNIQALNVTLDRVIEEAKKVPATTVIQPDLATKGLNNEWNKRLLSNKEQLAKQKKLMSAECRFWLENDKNNPTSRTKTEVTKYCGL